MTCPSCQRLVPDEAEFCPLCNAPLSPVAREASKLRRSTIDLVAGVPFVLFGVIALIWFAIQFLLNVGPAINAITGTPIAEDFFDAVWIIEARFYTVPVILLAFSSLMWALGGLFLAISGILSFATGKGEKPALGAVVLMLFGLASNIVALVVLHGALIENSGFTGGLFQLILEDWPTYLLQALLIVLVIVLVVLKKRAKRKRRYQEAAQRAQNRNAWRNTLAAQQAQAAAQQAQQPLPGEGNPPPPGAQP